nr:hypothetical protein CFP56_78077 [Quercus suber]
MFSTSRPASRGKPHHPSKEREKDSSVENSRSKRIQVTSENLQSSFENLVCVLSKCDGDEFDKQSVIEMVRSIYDWMVFDPSLQLHLPSAPGSSTVKKMWPHGSTIDTRKRHDRRGSELSPRRLKDLDQDDASAVSGSVVSSTADEDKPPALNGRIRFEPPSVSMDQRVASHQYSAQQHHSQDRHMQPHTQPQLPAYQYPPYSAQAAMRIVPEGFSPHAGSMPRYSIVGSRAPPPERVEETPEMARAQVHAKKTAKKPKVGTVRRGVQNEDEAEPTLLEDY